MRRVAVVVGVLALAACSRSRSTAHDAAPAAPTARPPSPFETFADTAPRAGEAAPAFELADLDGHVVRLADAVARGPVVLVFGSFT
jgi:hypothetical protein